MKISETTPGYSDYKRLFDLSIDLICVANYDGYFVDVNPQFCKTLGYSHEELTSRPWIDFVHPEDVRLTLAEGQKLATSNEPTLNFVNRYRTKDGFYKHLQWAASPESESQLLYCVVKDITAQVETEEKLRRSELYLRQAQRTARIGHWTVDLETRKPTWSEEVYRIYEVPVGQALGVEEGISFFDEASKPLISQAFTKCANEGIPYDIQLGMHTAEGKWKWVRATGQPEYCRGKIKRVFGVIQDLSNHHQMQKKLKEAKEKAETASKAKTDFLSNMSHEIRTPLNAVLGASNLLLDTDLQDSQRELLSISKYSGENLLNLVNDILDLSKIEEGMIQLHHAPFDPATQFDLLLKAHQLRAQKQGINLSLNLLHELPSMLIGDAKRIGQVVNNLLSNAIKFTKKGGVSLEVGTDLHSSGNSLSLHVKVKDTGIGIAREKQDLIFGSFEQAETDTTSKYGGTGLGLAISRNLVELMGGQLWVESELGKGATFGFSIQLKIAEKAEVRQLKLEEELQKNLQLPNGLKILLAEDNEINAEIIRLFLEKWGVELVLASNGEMASRMAREENFDLILMDLQMPKMGGKEATKKIRSFDLFTPIIALTASAPFEELQLLKGMGFNDLLSKPFRPEKFLQTIHSHVAAVRQCA